MSDNKKTSAQVFEEAWKLHQIEEEKKLKSAKLVSIHALHPNAHENYQVYVLVTLDGQVLNIDRFKTYTHLALPSFSVIAGIAKTDTLQPFPLVNGFVRQLVLL